MGQVASAGEGGGDCEFCGPLRTEPVGQHTVRIAKPIAKRVPPGACGLVFPLSFELWALSFRTAGHNSGTQQTQRLASRRAPDDWRAPQFPISWSRSTTCRFLASMANSLPGGGAGIFRMKPALIIS